MTKVLVAERDAFLARLLRAILRSAEAELEPVEVSDGAAAWAALKSDPDIRIVIVDAGLGGEEICRWARAELPGAYRYFVVVAGSPRQHDVIAALEAGADGVLTKPVSADELGAQIAVAQRLLAHEGAPPRRVAEALREAAASDGGEVVVRMDRGVGRVFFHRGRVAWVQAPGRALSPATLLGADNTVSREELVAVIDECKRVGAPFDEVLASWGLVAPDVLRERLRDWLAGGLAELLASPAPDVLFLPWTRAFAGRQAFALEDLVRAETLTEARPQTARPPSSFRHLSTASIKALAATCPDETSACAGCTDNAEATLDELARVAGVIGGAVVRASTGLVIAEGGVQPDADIVRAELHILNTLRSGRDDEVKDVVVSTNRVFNLLYTTGCPNAVLCVVADRARAALGPLRFDVSRLSARITRRDAKAPASGTGVRDHVAALMASNPGPQRGPSGRGKAQGSGR